MSGCPAYCSPKQPSHLGRDALADFEHLDVTQAMSPHDLLCLLHLVVHTFALHEYELSTGPHQGSGERHELREGTDGASRHLIEGASINRVFSASPQHGDVRQAEPSRLGQQPLSATFHGLNECHANIRSRNGQHETRKACAASYICDARVGLHVRSNDRTVQEMTRPQARKLERADEPELLPERREVARKLASAVEVITEGLGSSRWLDLRFGRRECFT